MSETDAALLCNHRMLMSTWRTPCWSKPDLHNAYITSVLCTYIVCGHLGVPPSKFFQRTNAHSNIQGNGNSKNAIIINPRCLAFVNFTCAILSDSKGTKMHLIFYVQNWFSASVYLWSVSSFLKLRKCSKLINQCKFNFDLSLAHLPRARCCTYFCASVVHDQSRP